MSPTLPTHDRVEVVHARPRRHLTLVSADAGQVVAADAPEVAAAMAAHPASGPVRRAHLRLVRDETGSLVAEYGLLMVLGATVTMLATKWATGGAIWELFGSVLSRARALVGA